MAATILGEQGPVFGTADDSGLIVMMASFRASVQTKEFLRKNGVCAGVVCFGKKGEHSFSGLLKAEAEVNGAIGEAMIVFGPSGGFGVTGGTTIVDSIDVNEKNEDLIEVNGQGSQYPSIS